MMGYDLAGLCWSAGSTPLFQSSENVVENKNLCTKLKKVKDFC